MSARFKDYTCPFNSDKSFSINNQLWPRGEIVNLECSKMVEAMLKFYNSFMSVFIKSVNINSVFPSWRSLSRFSHPVYQFPWKCLQLRRKFRFFLVLVQNSINVQNWWFCFDLIKGCNQISKSLLFFCFWAWLFQTTKNFQGMLYSEYWWYFENLLARAVLWNIAFCFHMNMYRVNTRST